MSPSLRRLIFGIVALLLLVVPVFLNLFVWQFNHRDYAPGHVGALNRAATPIPTTTPVAVADTRAILEEELRSGPVVVDLAHGNRLARAAFEPLAAALAERGVGMHFWLGSVDLLGVTNYYDFPDQSAELRPLLDDAAALVVISPFFLWSPEEIAVVERFVARGGRLLIISDPDILGDLAQDINNLAEPFGVVFHDDYLYNTVKNDGNFVHIFQDQFLDRAAELEGADIVLYGARSLDGEIVPQVRTGPNVLSSLRTGQMNFSTVATGGVEVRGTEGRVLAMTDFDVLTQPYVARHDNVRLLEFVADFLAAGEMRDNVVDFPTYLGKNVALVFGNASAVDAAVLIQGARLQQSLEATGRNLSLAGTGALTATLEGGTEPLALATEDETEAPPDADSPNTDSSNDAQDWLILADYELADETPLLGELGFTRIEETPTPTVTPTITATVTATVTPTATPTAPDVDEPDADEPDPQSTPTPNDETNGNDANGDDTNDEDTNDPENGAENSEETRQNVDGVQIDVTPEAPDEPTDPDDPADDDPADDDPADDDPLDDDPAPDDVPPEVPPITPIAPLTPTITPTLAITSPVEVGVTPVPTLPITPTATPEPEPTVYLVRDDGLRLLATQTILIAQRELPDGGRLVTVLGHDAAGISAGVDRLLARDYEGCITSATLVVCSYADGPDAPEEPALPDAPPTPESVPLPSMPEIPPPPDPDPQETPVPTPAPPDAPPDAAAGILIVDDDANAVEGEASEADVYLQTLTAQGHSPTLWSTADQGVPTPTQLLEYTWVVWSAGGYEGGGPALNALDSLLAYINEGGRLTISSRRPFFGMGVDDASTIVDVTVDVDIPALITGLPSEPFPIQEGAPPVIPLEINARENGPSIALRRGPNSENADAPLLFMVDDADEEQTTGARLMILGMSLTWFTEGHNRTLVTNMAPVMLED